MTNYEIIQQLEYIKLTTNQKIDMLISKLKVGEQPKKSVVKTVTSHKPIRTQGERNNWIEMSGQQEQMPEITM